MSTTPNLSNEVTLTVKLSDQDYDDLERWAKLTHAKAEVEAFAHRVTMETGTQVLHARAEEQKRLGGGHDRE